MSAINNSISTLSVENQTFYDRTLLSRLLPDLHFYNDAKKKKKGLRNLEVKLEG